ncbi:hypothetical protein [Pseudonocardia broussonetiae]|uniref:DUF998 domain-containing protein n=1 Tax=Pseudonocardia broussonetiae TaxID=2736640 RepID=A0A6M6JKV4_9PSEU|nr:hypothetical protein [Pseudonocardia broussonetiae]QJY47885.1 hypothetical protein HOP40_20485 [Pseudonocardia broussonetiae]
MVSQNAQPAVADSMPAKKPEIRPRRRLASLRVRTIGWIGLGAGVFGVGGGLLKVLHPASVDETRYSYPFDSLGFTVENGTLAVQHAALGLLVWGVWRSGAAGRSTLARIGAAGTITAWTAFAAVKGLAITARDEPVGSPLADTVDGLSGLAGTSIAVFSILLGIAVLRAHDWTDWGRFIPLVAGVFVFAAVIPSLILGSFTLARVAIIAWMGLWAALGWVLTRAETRASQPVTTRPRSASPVLPEPGQFPPPGSGS